VTAPSGPAGRGARRAVAALATLAALAAACSSTKTHHTPGPATSTAARSTSTLTTVAAVGVAPLTGLPVTDPALLRRPAVIVKVDNAPEARPQTGLDQADVVVEEKVEGGVARFMAVFQSHDADVGPVRSVRSTDPDVVRPIGGLFAYSGGITPFIVLLHATGGVVDVGFDADSSAYHRRSGRPAPHDLYTSVGILRQVTPAGMGPPPALFTYLGPGQAFGGAGAAPATHVTVPFGSLTVGEWQWDPASSTWLRTTNGTPHVVDGGGQLAFTTVIVEFVPYTSTGYLDPARTPVDRADVLGSGDAWILASGQIVRGHWAKAASGDVTSFTDAAGAPIAIPPGKTWITLAPVGANAQAS
jgi:Protein of unknown function (DUF3048) N-terminal domain/Protein of unknown function (DUF3048) C-terminal domain